MAGAGLKRTETTVSFAEMIAEMQLLRETGYGEGESGNDPESQAFAAEVRRLNANWEPGEIPRVPAGYEERRLTPEQREQREELIREREEWAYWPDGTLKADWLLVMGPEKDEAQQRRLRQQLLQNRARLEQLRRDGYWFDEDHRLQAPIGVATPGRVQVAARSPRRRSIRSSSAKARAPDEGDPTGPPDLRPALRVISRANFRRELERAGL